VLLIVLISMLPRVSAMGHFAGGAAGAIVAVPLVFQRFGHGLARMLGTIGVAVVPIVCVGAVFASIRDEDRIRTEVRTTLETVKHTMSVLEPLFDGKAKQWFRDQAKVERGAREVQDARTQLAASANVLRNLHNGDVDVQKGAEWALGLIDSWAAFFEAIDRLIAAKTPISDQDYANLIRDSDRAKDFQRKLEGSVIFAR